MNKKILIAGLLVSFMLIVPINSAYSSSYQIDNKPINQSVMGNTLFVGGNGGGNYSTIQSAINDASSGDTVFVYDDSSPYYENVVIDKSISLIGENRETTVIDGLYKGDVVVVETDYATINGFKIINCKNAQYQPEYYVIKAVGVNHLTIKNNRISIGISDNYQRSAGIYLIDSSNNVIQDNIICDDIVIFSYGIYLRNSDFNIISGNEIYNRRLDAIGISGCSDIQIYNNNIHDNEWGIDFYNGKNWDIINNTINHNQDYALDISSGEDIVISKNTIKYNGDGSDYCPAVTLFYVKNVNFSDNIVTYNDMAIIVLGDWLFPPPVFTAVLFSGNEISHNFDFGICIRNACHNVIENNNFRNNGRNIEFYMWYPMKYRNYFDGNYWDVNKKGPMLIYGIAVFYQFFIYYLKIDIWIPWIYFDWHPAKEPYDI